MRLFKTGIISFLMIIFLIGCNNNINNQVSISNSPSMDDTVYKYAVMVCKDAASAVNNQNGSFELKHISCILGQDELQGTLFYKIDYVDGVSKGENLDGTKSAYALASEKMNKKEVQIDNSLDDPSAPSYVSNAGARLQLRLDWAREYDKENAIIRDLDIDFINSNM